MTGWGHASPEGSVLATAPCRTACQEWKPPGFPAGLHGFDPAHPFAYRPLAPPPGSFPPLPDAAESASPPAPLPPTWHGAIQAPLRHLRTQRVLAPWAPPSQPTGVSVIFMPPRTDAGVFQTDGIGGQLTPMAHLATRLIAPEWQAPAWAGAAMAHTAQGGRTGGLAQLPSAQWAFAAPQAAADQTPKYSTSFEVQTEVDIFVSVGPHGASGSASCDHNNYTTCALWLIKIELPSKQVRSVYQLQWTHPTQGCPGGRYHLQPAAAPVGGRYAWQRCCVGDQDHPSKSDIAETVRMRFGMGSLFEQTVRSGSPIGANLPMYPNWHSDDRITFAIGDGTGAGGTNTLWSVTNWPTPGFADTTSAGAAGTYNTDRSYSDAFTHASPNYGGVHLGPRTVSFGGVYNPADSAFSERFPHVTNIVGDDEEAFVLPADWRPGGVFTPECHHPAWNPAGNRILCTRYQHAEEWPGVLADASTPTTYGLRRLFMFAYDAATGTWIPSGADAAGKAGAMVEPLVGAQFDNISVDAAGVSLGLFPPRENTDTLSEGCRTYVWKFAEWCATGRFVVATVFCSTGGDWDSSQEAVHARVVLIDLRDTSSASAYTDLTSIVEDHVGILGVPRGTYSGAFASCGGGSQPLALSPFNPPAGFP